MSRGAKRARRRSSGPGSWSSTPPAPSSTRSLSDRSRSVLPIRSAPAGLAAASSSPAFGRRRRGPPRRGGPARTGREGERRLVAASAALLHQERAPEDPAGEPTAVARAPAVLQLLVERDVNDGQRGGD